MIILAAALALSLDGKADLTTLNRRVAEVNPPMTCGIKVVGYHIAGTPGRQFRYGRSTYTIPSEGYVELIAPTRGTKAMSVDGRSLSLDEGALDGFGMRRIDLPAAPAIGGSK